MTNPLREYWTATFLILTCLFCLPLRTEGQWSTNAAENNVVISLPGSAQFSPAVTTDGQKGVVVVWVDDRNGTADLYAQRISAAGTLRWSAAGVPFVTAGNDQQSPAVALDKNMIYVGWQDNRNVETFKEIFLQKYDLTNGAAVWSQAIFAQQGNNFPPVVGISGENVYTSSYTTGLFDDVLSVQFIDNSGGVRHIPQKIVDEMAKGRQPALPPSVVPALDDGVVAAWVDARNDTALYVSGVSATGEIWPAGEIMLSSDIVNDDPPQIVVDGQQGAVVCWLETDRLAGTDVVKAARITASGNLDWMPSVVEIPGLPGKKNRLKISADDHQNIFLVWENDSGSGSELYFQRINLKGNALVSDVKVTGTAALQGNAELISSQQGAVILVWEDQRNGEIELFTQKIDSVGSKVWDEGGVALSTAFSGGESGMVLANDGLGGAVAVWQGSRNGDKDIFAQRVSVTGALGEFRAISVTAPALNDVWEIGSAQTVFWRSTPGIDSVRVELSRDGGGSYAVLFAALVSQADSLNHILVGPVPGPASEACRVRIRSSSADFILGESKIFRIVSAKGPDISIQAPAKGALHDSLRIAGEVTDLSGVQSVGLHYHQGGGDQFKFIEMTMADDGRFSASIPSDSLTERGVLYFVTATDSLNQRSFTDTTFLPVTFPEGTETVTIAPGKEENAYRMISAPNLLQDNLAQDLLSFSGFGVPDSNRWRIFQYSNNENVELDSSNAWQFRFDPGRAFWAISSVEQTLNFGAGESLPAVTSYSIRLKPGWNQIADPFAFPVSWNEILRKSGNPDISSPFSFKGDYSASTQIAPYEGYFVFNQSARDIELKIPAVAASKTTGFTKAETSDWQLQISAVCDYARDSYNFLGIRKDAEPEWDRLDNPEPPTIGDYVSVSFPHEEWRKYSNSYTTEFRPSIGEGQTWPVHISTNIKNTSIRLIFSGLAEIPDNLEVKLLDESLQISQDLRKQPQYVSSTGRGGLEKTMSVVIGSSAFVARQMSQTTLIPTHFELSQNFPNPFNPSTSIRFGLPKVQKVTVRIYDVLGREVRTLLDHKPQAAGYHLITWDGRNESRLPVASGLYIYRISTENFTRTRKMLLVK